IKAYEKVLELDPEHVEAAVALSPLYEEGGDWKKVANVYEIRLRHLERPEERIQLLQEAARIYEEKLKQNELALGKFIEAFVLDPSIDFLRENVQRLGELLKKWDSVVEAYTKVLSTVEEASLQVVLRFELGGFLWKISRIDEAIAAYRAIVELDPSHSQALEALDALYEQSARHAELLETIERRLEIEGDPETRRSLAYRKAALLAGPLDRLVEAIEAYQQIMTEWGDEEIQAYAALERIFEKLGRWEDLAELLEKRRSLALGGPEELAEITFRLASVCKEHLEQRERSVELFREALGLAPDHKGAEKALESFLDDAVLCVRAAEILEPIYEARGDWESLVRALEVLARHAKDHEQRIGLLLKAEAVLWKEIGDARRAFETLSRALREEPEHPQVLDAIYELCEASGWWRELVGLMEELAKHGGEDAERAKRLWWRVARIHDERLGDLDAAVYALERILELDSEDSDALDALEQLFTRCRRFPALIGVLRRKAELFPTEASALLLRVAAIEENELNDFQKAISTLKELLDIDPTHVEAMRALDRLFERLGMWMELADNLQKQLALASEFDEQIGLMLRIGALHQKKLGNVETAIEIYKEILERDRANAQAIQSLEELLGDPAHELSVAKILEQIYQELNEPAKLIAVLEVQAKHAESSAQEVELLHRIAELYELGLDEASKAFQVLIRALWVDPSHSLTQSEAERLAGITESQAQLGEAYVARAEAIVAQGGENKEENLALACALLAKA
ncbi:MAG: hypothetical protein N2515_01950, partial [Deltaproteobacteria bacterium]|nr:hypothetical protein [Deltaproteobacteria bacterium]